MKHLSTTCLVLSLAAFTSGCGGEHAHGDEDGHTHDDGSEHAEDGGDAHSADDGHGHGADDGHGHGDDGAEEDHGHDETPLGTIAVGDLAVELAQGHGAVVAGGESHLVVKLPYSDNGATIVRAWLGTSDRTLSYVGLGEYAASHDDYDIHATAPDPLPTGVQWYVEIERPDGTKLVGSGKPLL